METRILSAKYTNQEKTQFLSQVSVDGCEPFPFYVATEVEDDSEIYKQIMAKYRTGDFVPDDFALDADKLSYDIRADRNKLLSDTDYLVSPDYPISDDDREAVKAYRQALRDITKQDGFPIDIVWPEKPEVVK